VGHEFLRGAWRITILPDCDFDNNSMCDILDVDDLTLAIVGATHPIRFDLTGDNLVNSADLLAWLTEAGQRNLTSGNPYLVADLNLDGSVDGTDFNGWNAHKFTNTGRWSMGDFNADGLIDEADFELWFQRRITSSGLLIVVPEPSPALLAFGLFMVIVAMRHH
jgi:hypothetical protein